MKQSKNDWKAFLNLIKETELSKAILAVAVTLSLLETAAGLVAPLFMQQLIDKVTTASLDGRLLALLIGAFVLQALFAGLSFYAMTRLGLKVVASLRSRLWQKTLALPVSFFDEHESGETMSRITNDTSVVTNLMTNHLISFFSGIVTIVGAVAILLYLDWQMTLILLLAVPLSLAIIMPAGRKMYAISKKTQDEMAGFTAGLSRVLSDIRLVKSNNAEEKEWGHGRTGIDKLFRLGLREAKIQAVLSPLMTSVMMILLVAVLGYGGVRVAAGTLSAGALVAIIIYLFQIIVPFSQFATFFTQLQKAMGATARIQLILDHPLEEAERIGQGDVRESRIGEDHVGEEHVSETHEGVKRVSSEHVRGKRTGQEHVRRESEGGERGESFIGDIQFKNVTFAYKPGETILHDVDVTFPAGEITAIVGPSGGGKTTMFALLERFYSPDRGQILYAGQPIEQLPLTAWRSRLGYVSQESPIIAGTIRDNIVYGLQRDVSDEEVVRVAEMAYAALFIDELPERYETEVGERGIKLSGGQRQRIAIARALLRNPQILLLDEATSNLDSTSEQYVQHALTNLMEGRTSLVIAHRLSTVVGAAQIVVVEKGRITGVGTHESLIADHDLYRQLAEQQFGSGGPVDDHNTVPKKVK
ncbi:ABC transporter ATP-binding protein [Numidum massiliense]|uniref:ABC transporter ATP-binding protein n=1 Tax=Numidum massiliense TaxID=1522315 RepID=UPI0006D52DF2